jgi:hypothetical protein
MKKEDLAKKDIIVSRRSILKGAVGMSVMAAGGSLGSDNANGGHQY